MVDRLIAELAGDSPEQVVAYRGRHRWVQTFEEARLTGGEPKLREQGVYLITGGLGGIGLTLAGYLARAARAKLILIGRTGLPERGRWAELSAQLSGQDPAGRKIRELLSIEAAGAEVLVLSADVADLGQMREAVGRAEQQFGRVDGVIHAAGVVDAGLIEVKERGSAAAVLAPKVKGALVLAEIFRGRGLDFLALCSARTSLMGGVGQVDYTAANAFLDAFAHGQNSASGPFTVSINWGTWQEVGMAADAALPRGAEGWWGASIKTGILGHEGVEAFRRVLGSGLTQVIVSTEDLRARIEQAAAANSASLLEKLEETRGAEATGVRPAASGEYLAPTNETERKIAEIWQGLLGVAEVGIRDDFFELGGHSLLGLQVLSRLRANFQVELSLRSIFEAPTVAGLATTVTRALAEKTNPDVVAAVLAELEGLSDEEARQLMATEMKDPD